MNHYVLFSFFTQTDEIVHCIEIICNIEVLFNTVYSHVVAGWTKSNYKTPKRNTKHSWDHYWHCLDKKDSHSASWK